MSGWGSDWFRPEDKAEMAKAEQDAMLCGQGWIKITEDGVKHISVTETAPISKEAWDNISIREIKEYKPLESPVIQQSDIVDIPKFLNKKPTHDPYTNPNAHIYYECGCGAILDPGTKSFAQLNNHASEAGWKIRWGSDSYVPYCPKCGEDVE